MPSLPPIPSPHVLVPLWCGDAATAKGWPLYRSGAVEGLKQKQVSPFTVYACRLQGQRASPYRVALALPTEPALDLEIGDCPLYHATCDCPHAVRICKHVAALLYAVLFDAPPSDDALRRIIAGVKDVEPEAPGAGSLEPPTSEHWLASVERSWEEIPTPQPHETLEAHASPFGYWLGRAANDADKTDVPTVELEIRTRSLRYKDGTRQLGKCLKTRGEWEGFAHSATDQRILSLLRHDFPQRHTWDTVSIREHGAQRRIGGRLLAPLLLELASCGRCFWEGGTTPLRQGPSRQARLAWLPLPDGQMRLTLALPPGGVRAGVDPSVLVDVQNGTIAPLNVLAPSGLLPYLHNAPALSLPQAEAFVANAPLAMRALLPAATSPADAEETLELRPCMSIAHAPSGGLLGTVGCLYGEHEVGFGKSGEDPPMRVVEGDRFIRIVRDAKGEQNAQQQLAALSLTPDADGQVMLSPKATLQSKQHVLAALIDPLEANGWSIRNTQLLGERAIAVKDPVALTTENEDEHSAWFSVGVSIDVEGQAVDLPTVLAAALARPDVGLDLSRLSEAGKTLYLPLPDGRTVALPTERLGGILGLLQQILAGADRFGLGQAAELMAVCDTKGAKLIGRTRAFEVLKKLRTSQQKRRVAPPKQLGATLRDYQLEGVNWLSLLRTLQLGGVLADDMGLGKTLQIIAHITRCKEKKSLSGPVLVVLPFGLIANWEAELKKFSPRLTVYTHHGMARDISATAASDVVLTSYGVVARDAEALSSTVFDTIVLDESQQIKNPRGRIHHAVRTLRAKHRLCLSGTPMQNNLEELWAQYAFCSPGLLGDHRSFSRTFRRPIEQRNEPQVQRALNARVRPFMLRRTKADVAQELPEKVETIQKLPFDKAQAELYETIRSTMDKQVRKHIAARGLARSSVAILSALLQLRQVCCDPRLLTKTPKAHRVPSAKLQHLLELIETCRLEGRRMLIFSQFTSMIDLIGHALDKKKVRYSTLTGATKNRAQVVAEFQSSDTTAMLISLKAGGVGLNLTGADVVVHFDPWWNPAAQEQATDRAHRIGQSKTVFVYKLIMAGSVEEAIMQLQKKKKGLTDQLFAGGALSSQLTAQDVEGLFAPLTH